MNFTQIIRLVLKNIKLLIILPVLSASIIMILTRNQPKNYYTKSIIYTGIASGYSIESGDNTRVDHFATNNAFDNLLNIIESRKTINEVGLRLFVQNIMLQESDANYLSVTSYNELLEITPQDVIDLIDNNDFEKSLLNVKDYMSKDDNNFVYELIYLHHNHYSYEAISKIKVNRIANSDLIELSFESDDPGICKQTLSILNSVFIKNFVSLKENQTDQVVKYFKMQLSESENRLQKAEELLLKFNKNNNIINYDEQTKYIAAQHEKFEIEKQRVRLNHDAAKSVIEKLEKELGSQDQLKVHNRQILKLREELSKTATEKSLYETIYLSDTTSSEEFNEQYAELKIEYGALKKELKQAVDSIYEFENSLEVLPSSTLAQDWFENVIKFEENKAKLITLENRAQEFDSIYAIYAPLGATLKRIERQINISEQEYLSLLHSLSLAKLKQQNLEFTSQIKILDEPFFPISPLPSKRKILIALAGIIGFIIVVFIALVIEFFDLTIRDNIRALKFIELPVVSMFHKLNKDGKFSSVLKERTTDLVVKHIMQNTSDTKELISILFFSIRDKEGKSYVVNEIYERLQSLGKKTFRLDLSSDDNIIELNGFDKLIDHDNNGILLVEIPSIGKNIYPVSAIKNTDLNYLICRANRVWEDSDKLALDSFSKITSKDNLFSIINGVETVALENMIGDIPKNRSKFRIWFKNAIKLQFTVTQSI